MKTTLILELNAQHKVLLEKLDRLHERTALDSATIADIAKFKTLLAAHLDKEDLEFYPVMRKAAESAEGIRELLRVMGIEMDAIAAKAIASVDAWTAGKGAATFALDFHAFRELLVDRIQREERSLYATYLKLSED